MCLKEDYYSGLGSQMHAAYNTQIVVCRGIIVFYYLSQDRSDTRTLIPTLEGLSPCTVVIQREYAQMRVWQLCKLQILQHKGNRGFY